jgi:hypothetical protein
MSEVVIVDVFMEIDVPSTSTLEILEAQGEAILFYGPVALASCPDRKRLETYAAERYGVPTRDAT